MHARINFGSTITPDDGVLFRRDRVLPVLKQQAGYRGGYIAADRSSGRVAVASFWDSRAALAASEAVVAPLRKQGVRAFGLEDLRTEVLVLVATTGEQTPTLGEGRLLVQVKRSGITSEQGDSELSHLAHLLNGQRHRLRGADVWSVAGSQRSLYVTSLQNQLEAQDALPTVLRALARITGLDGESLIEDAMVAEVLLADSAQA